MSEADHVRRELLELNTGCLVTYRRAEDLMLYAPAGKVALVILATNDTPANLSRVLQWLRNKWRRCPIAVIGNEGGNDHEVLARQGGAFYLTRPVEPETWSALLAHVLRESVEQEQLISPKE